MSAIELMCSEQKKTFSNTSLAGITITWCAKLLLISYYIIQWENYLQHLLSRAWFLSMCLSSYPSGWYCPVNCNWSQCCWQFWFKPENRYTPWLKSSVKFFIVGIERGWIAYYKLVEIIKKWCCLWGWYKVKLSMKLTCMLAMVLKECGIWFHVA